MISTFSVLSSPQVSSPSCPGLSAEIPHRYPPYFSKTLSSGTSLGGDTKPTNRNKTSSYTETHQFPRRLYFHILKSQISK